MAIKNLRIKVPQAGSIRLGTPKTEYAPGKNVPYFRIEVKPGADIVLNDELMQKVYGEKPEKLRIYFPRKDPHDSQASFNFIFDSNYKAFKGGRVCCVGDGEKALRGVSSKEIQEVSCTCEWLTGAKPICKQRGELRVGLVDVPFVGYFQIATTSWNSIASISAVLDMYFTQLGEKFWTTKFVLYKEPAMLQGKPQYLVKLMIDPEDAKNLPTTFGAMNNMVFEDDDWELPPPAEDVVKPDAPIAHKAEKSAEYFSSEDLLDDSDIPDLGQEDMGIPLTPAVSAEPENEPLYEGPKPQSASPAPAPQPTPTPAPAEDKPPASAEPVRDIDPRRRMAEIRLRAVVNDYRKVQVKVTPDAFAGVETADAVVSLFTGKEIHQLTDAEVQSELGKFNQLLKELEAIDKG